MWRRLTYALFVLCSLLTVATALLWARSFRPGLEDLWTCPGSVFLISSEGTLCLEYLHTEAHIARKFSLWPPPSGHWGITRETYQGCAQISVSCPHWFVTSAFGLAALLCAARIRHLRRRTRAGCCPKCGYDLRASPDRCPECGTPRTQAIVMPSPARK